MGTIGIPRSLYYFHYHKLWSTFLKGLGFEVVISPPTNQEILNMGLLASVDGLCLPMKAFIGHAHYLVQTGVEQLFVPQIVSVKKREYTCPNFMGLPDLLKQSLPRKIKLLSPVLDARRGEKRLVRDYFQFGREFASPSKVQKSWQQAVSVQKQSDLEQATSALSQNGTIKILLLGLRYLTADAFLNGNIINQLKNLGVQLVTDKDLEANGRHGGSLSLNKPFFWSGARRNFEVLDSFVGDVDGVIILSPFGCGAQSLVNVALDSSLEKQALPKLELYFDEHTSPLGMQTRIEAFYDLLERKKRNEDNLSTFG